MEDINQQSSFIALRPTMLQLSEMTQWSCAERGAEICIKFIKCIAQFVHVIVALLGGGAGEELRVYNNLQPV